MIEKCAQCDEDFEMSEGEGGGAMIDTGDGAEPCCPDCLDDLRQCAGCEVWYPSSEVGTYDLGDGPELFCAECAKEA